MTLPLPLLAHPPILLAILTSLALFVHSDVDIALLWSQCHARARIPALSRIPALGTPSCFLVSFFQVALDSWRTKATMAVILSYVGALATVCWLESRRACNRTYAIITRPTLPWLVFNLLGGGVIWQLVIVPAFIHRARTLFLSTQKNREERNDEADAQPSESDLALSGEAGRMLPDSDIVAIPIAVAVGFFLPSVFMVFLNNAAIITIWLFFPVYIALVQKGVRYTIEKVRGTGPTSVLLEKHWQAMALVYALPLFLSVLSHIFFIWNMTMADDRRKVTKLTISFIEIDFQFIGFTVLYWLFVEAGWKLPAVSLGASFVLGPGAGICLGWLYREKLVQHGFGPAEEESEGASEDTPLLR
ncbi:hypothetical protein PT974_07322 [Cladobotryum mycophilum]|uniref:Uncharacterized protein n=1 Tax=Cladobotryum mycophilum TaxID=491253 RepID=A0ABR0SQ68_9HYPO